MKHVLESGPRLLGRAEFDSRTLWQRHPPKVAHANKRLVLEAAGGVERLPRGALSVARYTPDQLPALFGSERPELCSQPSAFDYPEPAAGTTEWHLNFADPYLFFAYGAGAFAQDEIQVAEHPILASLLEGLTAEPQAGLSPLTEEAGAPTPILIRGAERWCAIDTDPDLAMPHGIYGRRFGKAKPEAIRQAVTRLDVSYRTNLLAMAAPTGAGRYTRQQVQLILETAFTGFAAVRAESGDGRVSVHTGHWGTGAFGGNRVLMALLQVLAAQLGQVDALVYHSLDSEGVAAYDQGASLAARLLQASPRVADAVGGILEIGFSWGTSDGN